MKRNLLLLLAVAFLASLIKINTATALMQPYSRSDDSRLRALESKQFHHDVNEYESPETKMARMIMEMSLENAENEKLKEEIKNEMANQVQAKQPAKTNEEICKASIGENSQYNTLLKKCECAEEYKLYNNKCISKLEHGNKYCEETIGINSKYDSEKDSCTTNEDYCKEKLGDNSKYSIVNNQCECVDGFILNENTCIDEKPNSTKGEQLEIENKPLSLSERFANFFQKLKFW